MDILMNSPWIKFTKTKPKWMISSNYLDEKAIGYFTFLLGGLHYFCPLTKDMKTLFGIKTKGKDVVFENDIKGKREKAFEKVLLDITSALLLQTRNTVGNEIEENLMKQLTTTIERALAIKMHNTVTEELNKKLLPPKWEAGPK